MDGGNVALNLPVLPEVDDEVPRELLPYFAYYGWVHNAGPTSWPSILNRMTSDSQGLATKCRRFCEEHQLLLMTREAQTRFLLEETRRFRLKTYGPPKRR